MLPFEGKRKCCEHQNFEMHMLQARQNRSFQSWRPANNHGLNARLKKASVWVMFLNKTTS